MSLTISAMTRRKVMLLLVVVALVFGCIAACVVDLQERKSRMTDSPTLATGSTNAGRASLDSPPNSWMQASDVQFVHADRSRYSAREASKGARQAVECLRLMNNESRAESLLRKTEGEASPALNELYDEQLAALQEKLASPTDLDRPCDGLDLSSIRSAAYAALLTAAQLGDAGAAACYIAAQFQLAPEQMSPARLAEYKSNSRSFIDRGVANGDWRFVDLAASASSFFFHRNKDWFGSLMPYDENVEYQYLRLELYGATGGYAQRLGERLQKLRNKLAPTALQQADSWAASEFEQHFSNSPKLNETPQPCEFD